MKQINLSRLAMTLGLLLALSACTAGGQTTPSAGPAAPDGTAQTAETAAAPTQSPASVGTLHMVWEGSDIPSASGGQLYEPDSTYLYDPRCLTAVDLQNALQQNRLRPQQLRL